MRATLLTFDFGESVVPLATALAEHIDVQLLIPAEELEPFAGDLADAVELQTFTKPRFRQPGRQLALMRRLLDALRRFEPDVLHVQQGHLWFNLALPSLRGIPLVVTVHDPKPHLGDRLGKKTPQVIRTMAHRRARQVIVHAEAVRQALLEALGLNPAAVHVIPLAFGDGPTTPEGLEGPLRVLFFGRIWPYKGLDYLIRAEPLVSERIPDVRFVIAGQGEDFDRYRALMVHPHRFVVENGFISMARREELFALCGVVALPYVDATQTGVIPLAFRHGKPVIATTVGGLPEVVEDGRSGLLVPPRDVEGLAQAILALADASRRKTMGRMARAQFERTFDPAAIAARTLEVYGRALR